MKPQVQQPIKLTSIIQISFSKDDRRIFALPLTSAKVVCILLRRCNSAQFSAKNIRRNLTQHKAVAFVPKDSFNSLVNSEKKLKDHSNKNKSLKYFPISRVSLKPINHISAGSDHIARAVLATRAFELSSRRRLIKGSLSGCLQQLSSDEINSCLVREGLIKANDNASILFSPHRLDTSRNDLPSAVRFTVSRPTRICKCLRHVMYYFVSFCLFTGRFVIPQFLYDFPFG